MSKHFTSVDQSDRLVPYNLRQSGETPVEMLIFTRVRKSPFWHLSAIRLNLLPSYDEKSPSTIIQAAFRRFVRTT